MGQNVSIISKASNQHLIQNLAKITLDCLIFEKGVKQNLKTLEQRGTRGIVFNE